MIIIIIIMIIIMIIIKIIIIIIFQDQTQMAALTNSASLLDSDYLAYREEGQGDSQQGDTVNKIRGTMDNLWTRLRKGWGKKTPVVKGNKGMGGIDFNTLK